jgi:hypothetical protein
MKTVFKEYILYFKGIEHETPSLPSPHFKIKITKKKEQ